jgi:hypothetical protein
MPANTTIIVKEETTIIAGFAFRDCIGLTSVTISNSVTEIGFGVFSGSGLISVIIPNSVIYIGPYTFSRCNGLTEVTISNSVKEIEQGTFENCTG